ncbi:MAG: hypothetical protein LBU42_05975 [Prevotellaceae bacterium]|jgi:hypothetical protein|nr:hypothetical protein [Prevotellaceae bacterium]
MKKILFSFAMLVSVAANATVTVTPISTNYTVPPTVTFKVEWTNTPTAPYNNRVWVWIDFCPVTGTTPANSFSTATISNPIKIGGNGTVTNATERGFFIEYGATNNGTTVTATLNATGKFNWCAYGSDYPPNVLANTNSSYTLAGTPPFKLIASNGTTAQTVTGMTLATSALTITPATITDATGYPGLWCPYTGSDLYMDDSHRCMERQSGAGNWEAYIKDNRDDIIYRITQNLDNSWWMAEYMKNADKRVAICNGISYYSGNNKPNCPDGWQLPTSNETKTRFIGYSDEWGAALGTNGRYIGYCISAVRTDIIVQECTQTLVWLDHWKWVYNACDTTDPGYCSCTSNNTGNVRCRRQL